MLNTAGASIYFPMNAWSSESTLCKEIIKKFIYKRYMGKEKLAPAVKVDVDIAE